jgi:hypothetical protein
MSRAIAAEKSGTVLLNGVDIIEFDVGKALCLLARTAANVAHRELGPVVRVLTRKSCIAFNCARWLNSFKFQRDSGFRFAAIRHSNEWSLGCLRRCDHFNPDMDWRGEPRHPILTVRHCGADRLG